MYLLVLSTIFNFVGFFFADFISLAIWIAYSHTLNMHSLVDVLMPK